MIRRKNNQTRGSRLGRMVKAVDSGSRGPGFDSHDSLKLFTVYSIDVMINAPMTYLDLN